MAQRFGKERLQALRKKAAFKEAASPLYRWLVVNAGDIEEIRQPGEPWGPYLQAAIESGVHVDNDGRGLRKIAKLWDRLQKIRKKEQSTRQPASAGAPRSSYPSQTSADWKPVMQEAVPTGASRGHELVPSEKTGTPEKNSSEVARSAPSVSRLLRTDLTDEEIERRADEREKEIMADIDRRLRKREPGFYRD